MSGVNERAGHKAATDALPERFAELQPYVANWARATEYERAAERRAASSQELVDFYQVALKHLPEILRVADTYPLDEISGPDRTLFWLALSLAEVAPHVELYRNDPDVPFAFDETRLRGAHCGVED